MYLNKLMDTWTEYDPDILSFVDIVNEYTSRFGQQLIVTFPSSNYYEVEDDNGKDINCT